MTQQIYELLFQHFDYVKTYTSIFNIDQKKKQEDYSKMIEGYSEEFKSKYSELIQTVDTIQENLTPVRLRLYICILKYEV